MIKSKAKEEKTAMHEKLTIIISVILVLNVIVTCLLGIKILRAKDITSDATPHYTLYVGTNDKDAYEQIIPTEQVKEILDKICMKYVDGYTITDAIGAWVDESDIITHENTVVCYIDYVDIETVHRIADEIRTELNQNTVLIQIDYTHLDFYAGADGK